MARTRSIKADFWDDEKLASVSRDARLLFIGLWKCSDDYGVTRGNSVWIKNQIFPYDDLSKEKIEVWLTELESIQCISVFDHNGEKFFFINNFLKHQSIDKPSKTRNPLPPSELISEHYRDTRECLSSDSRESSDEVEVEVEVKRSGSKVEVGGEPETIQKIVELYQETCCPPMPKVLKLTATRERQLNARWKEKPDLDFWKSFFKRISESHFLSGRAPPGRYRDKSFLADLEWVTNASNFVKICEGKYDNRNGDLKHDISKPSNPKYDGL